MPGSHAGLDQFANLTLRGGGTGRAAVANSRDALEQPHLWIYRLDRTLSPTALYEIRTPAGELVGRAVERCETRWLRWLKCTRLREATPLQLDVEAADRTTAFTIRRDWDWLDRKPVSVFISPGVRMLTFRAVYRWRMRLPLTQVDVLAPDGRLLGTLHPLQPWAFRDRQYQLRDSLNRPLADVVWLFESWWSPSRRGELRVHRPRSLPPFSFVAVALFTGLRAVRR